MTPRITAFYAALSALLIVWLALRVALQRRRAQVGIGDGGDRLLARAVRAHGNAIEYVPLALLLLLLLELLATPALWLHVAGAVLLSSRLVHAWGLSRSAGVSSGRLFGTLGTWVVILVMSVVLIWQSLAWWLLAAG